METFFKIAQNDILILFLVEDFFAWIKVGPKIGTMFLWSEILREMSTAEETEKGRGGGENG